jgi:multicomponent Na+:H+ antiporter subunit F
MQGITHEYGSLLLFCLVFLAVTMSFCLLRGILGPRFTDRIVAVNMIGTKTILLIAVLSVFFGESYLVDVCLVYALISFLAVVILSKVYLIAYNKRRNGEQPEQDQPEQDQQLPIQPPPEVAKND